MSHFSRKLSVARTSLIIIGLLFAGIGAWAAPPAGDDRELTLCIQQLQAVRSEADTRERKMVLGQGQALEALESQLGWWKRCSQSMACVLWTWGGQGK